MAESVMNSPEPRDGLRMQYRPGTGPRAPMPPGSTLPKPREVRALIKLVPDGIDASLSTGVRNALETAAVKLEKDDVVEALAAMRSAQSHLYSASRKDAGLGMPAVYGASIAPAEKSSALAQMQAAYRQQAGDWRKIGMQVAGMIARIRRHIFRGHINGFLPNVRI